MLADIYNWFTEGFDTPDLQAARMLLEALSLDPESLCNISCRHEFQGQDRADDSDSADN